MSNPLEGIDPELIEGIECKHVVFIPALEEGGDDYHYVKEVVHLKDKTLIPKTKVIKNYQRPYMVTKEAYRDHTQKKEWEEAKKVQLFKSTQSNLVRSIARTLDMPGFKGNLKRLMRAPKEAKKLPNGKYRAGGQFVYGADILSTSVIKQEEYMSKYPQCNSFATVACTDTETNMITRDGKIIMQTISMGKKVYTAIDKAFVANYADPKAALQEAMMKYLPELINERGATWEIDLVDNQAIIVCKVIEKAHQWMPDFLAMWNADFDVKKMVEALEWGGMDPKDVFSDPRLPHWLRMFEYKEGTATKVTASGKQQPLAPHMRWNTVVTPASFYIVDSMCAYKQIRTGKQEERSYGLDFILNKHLKRGKLKFTAADHLKGADWHTFMQTHYPLEYVIYNVFDCVGMELLDEKTRDLAVAMPQGAIMSDYSRFNSQPRRVCDKLHYFCLERGKVMGTTSDEMKTELDDKVISLRQWIVMLPAHLVADNGLQLILEYPQLRSNIRTHIGDLDVSASYPNGGSTHNISKETTKKELVLIHGVSEHVRRMQGINFSGGATNAVEICSNIFKMPTISMFIEAYRDQANTEAVQREYKEAAERIRTQVHVLQNEDGEDVDEEWLED